MGMYGYPIEEEDFQKDIEKEVSSTEEELDEVVEDAWSNEDNNDNEEEIAPIKKKGFIKEDEPFFKRAAKNFIGAEPTFMEKLTPLISKEDVEFLRKDMVFYAICTGVCFVLGILLSWIAIMVVQQMWMVPFAFAFLFGNDIIFTFWKGRYWEYCSKSYRSKKLKTHKSVEELAKEIPEFRKGTATPPIRKWNIVKFCLIVAIGIYIAL